MLFGENSSMGSLSENQLPGKVHNFYCKKKMRKLMIVRYIVFMCKNNYSE